MANNITIRNKQTLSDEKYPLTKVSFSREKEKGGTQEKDTLVYDPGDAVTILLYNKGLKTVLLTKQFRMPTYLNGNPTGMVLETCAGKIERESPEEAIKREVEEELGYRTGEVQKLFQVYMSPGIMTEIVHFYTAPYEAADKVSEGGGLEEEQEDVQTVELDFDQALSMMHDGRIQDAKTVLLLLYAQVQGYFA